MEIRKYFEIIGRWLWFIVLSIAVAAGSSYLASKAATPIYQTKTTLMVGQVTRNPDPNSGEIYASQQLANTYIQLARREPVLRGAVERLGLPLDWRAVSEQVTTNIIQQTQLIEIYVKDSDPIRAQLLADAIAQELILQSPSGSANQEQGTFIQNQLDNLKVKIENSQKELIALTSELDAANSARQIQALQNQIDALDNKISDWQKTYSQLLNTIEGGDINALKVVENAFVPTVPVSPNVTMNVLLAAAAGLILSLGGVFLIEYLDDTIKTSDDVTNNLKVPALGAIGTIEGREPHEKLIAYRYPLSPIVESFRVLRMNLLFASPDRPVRTLAISSSSSMEGKTVTLANLAVVMAQAGHRVILVDSDLRRPSLHKVFNIENQKGLCNAIVSPECHVTEYLQESGIEKLRILTSGSLPPSPAEVLGSERMGTIIEQLKAEADYILFDTPPVQFFADASILATRVDGILLVCRAGFTRTNEAKQTVNQLRGMPVKLLGFILVRQRPDRRENYYYYRYRENPVTLGQKLAAPVSWLKHHLLPARRSHPERPVEDLSHYPTPPNGVE